MGTQSTWGISSSRDNSIIFIKVLIRINVCDLDVELDIYICAEANNSMVCSTFNIYMIWFKIDVSQIGFYLKFISKYLVRKEFRLPSSHSNSIDQSSLIA